MRPVIRRTGPALLVVGCLVPALSAAGKGNWVTSTQVSPIDDQKTIAASTSAVAPKGQSENDLVVRCRGGALEVFMTSKRFVSGIHSVRIRVDKEAPETWWAQDGAAGAAIFLDRPHQLLEKIRDASSLAIEYTPYGEVETAAVFKVAGSARALRPALQACPEPDERTPTAPPPTHRDAGPPDTGSVDVEFYEFDRHPKIRVDGEESGRPPTTLRLRPGLHTVTILNEDQQVLVEAGKTLVLTFGRSKMKRDEAPNAAGVGADAGKR